MKFGVAKDIITPKARMHLACPTENREKHFLEIHDNVYVRALVLYDEKEYALFMSFDLLFHNRSLNDAIEQYAEKQYGIKPESVVISYTHSHMAPATLGYNPGYHSEEYEAFLIERAKDCLDRAMCTMREGTIEYGCFEESLNVSRRGIRDGEFVNAPNEDYPHDKNFSLLVIRDLDGKVASVMANYASHPVFYPSSISISGEFPARMCEYIDIKYYGCISMYFQSACGDVRPSDTADFENKSWKKMCFDDIDSYSKKMADAVTRFIDGGNCKGFTLNLSAVSFLVDLPMEKASYEYFEKFLEEFGWLKANPNIENAKIIVNGGYEKLDTSLSLHCGALRLGKGLYVASLGGEPVYGIKRSVERAFEENNVIFIGYTDSCAYIVDDKMLDEGGYEPSCHLEYGLAGPFKKGIDKKIETAFSKAYESIK